MGKAPRKNALETGVPEANTLEHEEFLTRWSRRKAASREGVNLPEPVDEPARDGQSPPGDSSSSDEHTRQSPVVREDGQGEQAPIAAELPPIESLGEDSDYSAFLASDVPADLQRKALRKLFQSPKFNVRDGLDDYDLDFSSPEPLGDIVTAEMRHRLRIELERLAGLDDDRSAVENGDQDVEPSGVAESEEREQSADSEPDDDQPATA